MLEGAADGSPVGTTPCTLPDGITDRYNKNTKNSNEARILQETNCRTF